MRQESPESRLHRTILYDDAIDLKELWQTSWQGKKTIALCVAISAIMSVTVVSLLPNIYRSEALLAPVESDSASGLTSLADQFGSFASVADISLGNGGNKSDFAIEVLKSRQFLTMFIKKHNILVPVCAAKEWDSESKQWVIDENIYDINGQKWVPTEYTRAGKGPSDWKAVKAFNEYLTVSQNKKNGFITVGLELYSPDEAQQWLVWLIEDLNSYMKYRDVSEAEKSIVYLKEQASKTSIADMQSVFYQLIEKQIQTTLQNF